jgi:hypothetical protein
LPAHELDAAPLATGVIGRDLESRPLFSLSRFLRRYRLSIRMGDLETLRILGAVPCLGVLRVSAMVERSWMWHLAHASITPTAEPTIPRS